MVAVFVISSCNSNSSESSQNPSSTSQTSTTSTKPAANSNVTSTKTESADNSSKPETSRPDESDMDSFINWYFDIIFATKLDDKLESEIADEFPDEFSTLVALGEKAFTVLDKIINNNDVDLIQRAFAYYIKYKIKPELFDLSFSSPNDKYSINCSVSNFITTMMMSGGSGLEWLQYDNVRLVDKSKNMGILTTDLHDSNIEVKWRADSNYAAISYGYGRYYTITDVFDVKNSKLIKLPDIKQIGEMLDVELSYQQFTRIAFRFGEWLPDNKVKLKILTMNSESEGEGWFIYDLQQQKVIDSDFKVITTN